jgi:primosomal protein N' (replication factor Y)
MVAPIRHRARRLRRHQTLAEHRLWQALRSDALGVAFRRQHPVPPYVVDFACVGARLIVEVDGAQHGGNADANRDAALRAAGWRVMRFWNDEVLTNIEGIVARIAEALRETT